MQEKKTNKNWQDKPSDSWIFSGADFKSPVLYLLLSRKPLKTFMMTNCSLWLAKLHKTSRNLLEKYVLDCMQFLYTKITYILTFPPTPASLGQFLGYLKCCLPTAVFILPLIKLNLQLSCWAFFLSWQGNAKQNLSSVASLVSPLWGSQ